MVIPHFLMKYLYIFFLKSTTTFFIVLICLTRITLSQTCVEHLSTLNGYETKIVDCPMVSSTSSILDKRQTSDNMFVVNFHCLITDSVLCKKAENVFNKAGRFITATLNLKSPVTVNATLSVIRSLRRTGRL